MKRTVLIIAVFLLSARAVFAGLAVSPARSEITIPAEGEYSGAYSVKNEYDIPMDVSVSFRDWFVSDENKGISVSQWLTFPTTNYHLAPGETAEVPYSVKAPKKAKGALVGMVSFVPEEKEPGQVLVVISVSMYVTVAGTQKLKWELGDLKVDKAGDGLQFNVLVRNKGNVHVRPKGFIDLYRSGKPVGKFNFMESRPVYPGAARSVVAVTPEGLPLGPGDYKAKINVSYSGQSKKKEIKFRVDESGKVVR